MQESNGQIAIAGPPLGIFEARCDEKGRLKLPTNFAEYLRALDKNFFITTIDLKQARIYPRKVWESNQLFCERAGEDADLVEDVTLIANHYGADSEIDGQGRVLMPTTLRRELELEAAPVWIDFYNSGVNVAGKRFHEERMQRARFNLGDKVKILKQKGFK